MLRFIIFCLCSSLIWASPNSKGFSKITPRNLPGGRIVNGEPASLGQFPYQAAVHVRGSQGNNWFCGGSILNEEWILTAGHCVIGGLGGRVVTGSLDPSGNTGGQINDIEELILHEKYDFLTLANDIGLIRLAQPLRLGEDVEAIRLDPQNIREGQEVTVSGWGLTSEVGAVSNILNFVNLVVITNQECEEAYHENILEEMVCATSDNNEVKSTCNGDSGGPMVIREGEQLVQVAVISFVADSGCESGAPSGYTRVAPYVDWIQRHIG